jgi:mycothiol synthase
VSPLELFADAEAYDGVAPADEAVLLTLAHRPEVVREWWSENEDGVALMIGSELTLVVHPKARGHGVATRLFRRLRHDYDGPVSAWAHGAHPGAAALAARFELVADRTLWVMRRQAADLPSTPADKAPASFTIRGFEPGDEAELLRVNAAAFASHPEQGALDLDGLRERMAEPWFDPTGLLLAFDADDKLLGFHWTKRHPPLEGKTRGEVYVIGISPDAQGLGLGRALLLAGLAHLADVDEVHLYVEASNGPAIGLYAGLGFTLSHEDTHIQYVGTC